MIGVELLVGPWAITCVIGLTTFFLLYCFSIHNHAYWKKRGIPFDKPLPFVGSMWEIFKKPLHEIEYDRYFKYGPIYGHFEGSKPLLSVADLTLLRDILVKDFPTFSSRRILVTGDKVVDSMLSMIKGDEEWKRIRTIVTPTFTTGKIKRMLSIFSDCSNTLMQNFREFSEKGKPIDAKRLYGAFSMDIIASSAFSTKIDSHNDPDNQFVTKAKIIFTRNFNWRFFLLLVAPRLVQLLKIDIFSKEVMNFFKDATYQIMEERKRTKQTRNDFLQLLMDTAKEVASEEKGDFPENGGDIASNYGEQADINPHILKTVTSKTLSLDELVAQCVIFFIAGYDTTASTLSFSTYLLALNPDIQAIARKEVDEALKESDGKMTYEAIQRMKYLDNVISETLRIYPPATRLERVADHDYKLGDTGITVPKGMVITIPTYAMHKDPKLFPDPEKFDPDRFTPEERAKRDPYSYLPFGAGPRNCVAMRFALMEVKVCLAHVIANFYVKINPETKIPLEFALGQGLLQPKGIFLDMEVRKDSPLVK